MPVASFWAGDQGDHSPAYHDTRRVSCSGGVDHRLRRLIAERHRAISVARSFARCRIRRGASATGGEADARAVRLAIDRAPRIVVAGAARIWARRHARAADRSEVLRDLASTRSSRCRSAVAQIAPPRRRSAADRRQDQRTRRSFRARPSRGQRRRAAARRARGASLQRLGAVERQREQRWLAIHEDRRGGSGRDIAGSFLRTARRRGAAVRVGAARRPRRSGRRGRGAGLRDGGHPP